MKFANRISTLALLLAGLGGCASIVDGSTQVVSVKSVQGGTDIIGANCTLSNNKGSWFMTTPNSAAVHRSIEDLAVTCTKDGFAPGTETVKSTTKAMAFGNILFGGLIGVGTDMATGAAYDYPQLITVTLPPATSPAPVATTPGSPSS
jgi:hypothetical protein